MSSGKEDSSVDDNQNEISDLNTAFKSLDVGENHLSSTEQKSMPRNDSGYFSRKGSANSDAGRRESMNSEAGDAKAGFIQHPNLDILQEKNENSSEDKLDDADSGTACAKPEVKVIVTSCEGADSTATVPLDPCEEETQSTDTSNASTTTTTVKDGPCIIKRSMSVSPVGSLLPDRQTGRRYSIQVQSTRPPLTRRELRQSAATVPGVSRIRTFTYPVVMVKTHSHLYRGRMRRRHSDVTHPLKTYTAREMPFDIFEVSSFTKLRKRSRYEQTNQVSSFRKRSPIVTMQPDTVAEEKIKEAIHENIDCFYQYINWDEIYRYLQKFKLLNNVSGHYLNCKDHSSTEKSNNFFFEVLPTMGSDAYARFYKCLQSEREHSGHRTLEDILTKALR